MSKVVHDAPDRTPCEQSQPEKAMKLSESRLLQARSHVIIPGGSHTYAKGDDQFPEQAPGFIARGKGCHVWDVDGNEFIEYGMGLRAVTLGHAFEPVLEAAHRQMQLGSNFSRPAKIEVDLAEAMLEIIDGADMVKFAKNGSDVTTRGDGCYGFQFAGPRARNGAGRPESWNRAGVAGNKSHGVRIFSWRDRRGARRTSFRRIEK